MRTNAEVHTQPQDPAIPVAPQLQYKSHSQTKRMVMEPEWLEEVGWLPQSLPTQQLAQMAAEAGSSMLGGVAS